jgi:hypothetical protein
MPHDIPGFLLLSKGAVLGRIQFSHEDWPWNYGKFFPAEPFRDVEELFRRDASLLALGDSPAEMEERDAATRQIVDLELELHHATGGALAGEPDLLHIRGDEVWWRGFSGALRGAV